MPPRKKFNRDIRSKNEKLPYKKDGLFYSLWKYANASRLTEKSLITFIDLAPLEGNLHLAVFYFLNSLQELKIELEDITFHENIYKEYCKTEYDYITNYITKNPKADFSKTIKKLLKNKATFDDIFKILGKFDEPVKMKLQLNGLLEFIEFSSSPSVKNMKPLKEYLEIYIKFFIDDKLFSPELKNFYQFSRQKEIFLCQIKNKVENYGAEFVFKHGYKKIISALKSNPVFIKKDEAYLFVHTLAALEKQELFKVKSILIRDMSIPPKRQTNDYKVKIVASESLFKESFTTPNYKSFEKETEKLLSNNKVEFDDEKATLKIGKYNISLPPYKNEHYFCRTIFEHGLNEPVDWSILYEKMTGYYEAYYGKAQQTRKNWRLVYDTMRLVNKRIKEHLKTREDLFTWQEKTVRRKF
jgi:hypothetical protein